MKVKVKLKLLRIDDELEVELKEDATVKTLLERLNSMYGDAIRRLIGDPEKGFRVCAIVNGEIIKYDQKLKDKDELSLILPAAGG